MNNVRTLIQCPPHLLDACARVAHRFRAGEWGFVPKKHHRDAVFLYESTEGPPKYRLDVWGDPIGRVSVHGHVLKDGQI